VFTAGVSLRAYNMFLDPSVVRLVTAVCEHPKESQHRRASRAAKVWPGCR
jgi:hypothetical protein